MSAVSSDPEVSFLGQREKKLLEFDPRELTPPFPKNALFELTNWCNHACVFCTNPRMVRGYGSMPIEFFRRVVGEAVELGLEEVGLYTTGEPFFTKNLNEFVAAARTAGAKYIYVTTNGALATPDRVVPVIEAGLSSIKFSINAGSRETYKLVHGKDDWDQVVENIRFIARYRKEKAPHLKMMSTCVVTKFVEAEKPQYMATIGPLVDEVAFYPVGGQAGQSLEQLDHIRVSDLSYPRAGGAEPCSMLWNRLHVTCEGYLDLCCVDYEDALTYADLNETSLRDAWQNATIREMRRRHQVQQLEGTLCQNCLYGTRDKVYPISKIGHPAGEEIVSNKQKGVDSVDERISSLVQLGRKAASAG